MISSSTISIIKLKHILLLALLSSGLLGFIAPSAVAQQLAIHHTQELDFGNQIFPGIEKSIAPTDPGAAAFVISGEPGKQVQLQFTLSDHLRDAKGSNMTIFFPSTAAGSHSSAKGKTSADLFDPQNGLVTNLNAEGKLYLWLGAVIAPNSYQPGNNYEANLLLEVNYLN